MKIQIGIKLLSKIFGKYLKASLILLVLLFLSALFESLSLLAMWPLAEVIINNNINNSFIPQNVLEIIQKTNLSENDLFVAIILLMLFLIILKAFVNLFAQYTTQKLVWTIRRDWQREIFSKYMFISFQKFTSKQHGTLLNNLLNEPHQAADFLVGIIRIGTEIILSIFLISSLLITSWQATILSIVFFGGIYFSSRVLSRQFASSFGTKRIRFAQEYNNIANESLKGIREIKVFTNELFTIGKFKEQITNEMSWRIKFHTISYLPNVLNEVLITIAMTATILIFNYKTTINIIEIFPIISVFLLISRRLMNSVNTIMYQRMAIYASWPSVELTHKTASEEDIEEILEDGLVFEELQSDINIENLKFRFVTKKNNSFSLDLKNEKIPKGKITAIIGPSGSGKSTMINLLLGLLTPDEGNIIINHKSLKNFNLKSWRTHMALVAQSPFMLNTTIKENLLFGNIQISEGKIDEALEKASAKEFVDKLDEGKNTIVGENGAMLSGGQIQRLAIARAILRNPQVIIFDEPTSALDEYSSLKIRESIEMISKVNKTTIIIISHDQKMIENAHHIIKLG